ncbi:MAG TPA: hypothetical protein DD658_01840 [Deltaproteobacteria bacterium]|nr:MAG: hypothetical protein A2X88_02155 [Deltaproteobacteria bacterium GWC2_65_14]HBO68935.1 hypothetical protein [Deltaproteobacteria bacterium]
MENGDMSRLFSVYKVENGEKILLGGLVERRGSRRKHSNRMGLLRLARKKFAESPDQDIRIVLKEER